MSASAPSNDSDFDRPLWGARSIAAAAGIGERRAWNLLERELLPGKKVGRTWVTTKRALMDRIMGRDGYVPPEPKPKSAPPKRVPKSLKKKLRLRKKAA
jgi:hypothetical protein